MPSLAELRSELKTLRKEHCPPVSRAKKEHIISEIARYKSPAAAAMAPVAPAPISVPEMKGPPSVEVAIKKATKKLAKEVKKEEVKKGEKKVEKKSEVKKVAPKKKKGE